MGDRGERSPTPEQRSSGYLAIHRSIAILIVDGHEDLAYNALVDGRNYLQSAYVTRAAEDGGPIPEGNGLCMLGLP